jgi:hypothetical protein
MGTGNSGVQTYINRAGGAVYTAINSSAYTTTAGDINKLVISTRNSDTNLAAFLDKVKDQEARASSAIPNAVINIGTQSTNEYSFAFISGGLDDTDVSDMYDVIVDGYLSSIGAKI